MPAAEATVVGLMSGEVFTAIAEDRAEVRSARLEAILAGFVDEGTRVAWVGNPLRSALTIERFLLQVVGPEVDLRPERDAGELARLLATRTGSETRLLIVVQQPETINPETLERLGGLAGHLGGEPVQVQFLFVGSAGLRLPDPAPMVPLLPAVARLPARPAEPRRRDVLPLALLFVLVLLGLVVPRPAPVPVPAPAAVAEPARAQVAEPDLVGLRRQFDQFLAGRAGSLPALTAAQKDALFNEFLTFHRRE